MKEPDLNIIEVPEEQAKIALKRIKPFLKLYHRTQLMELEIGRTAFTNFGIRELLFSVYTQGVLDGQQLPNK